MARVMTFANVFPKTHPRAGENTFFVEQILSGDKKHTIRTGDRWKPGDKFSPRIWSGLPYRSKQFQICEDLTVKKTYVFHREGGYFFISEYNKDVMTLIMPREVEEIAKNDGLSDQDFKDWFDSDFEGQMIIWDEDMDYSKILYP